MALVKTLNEFLVRWGDNGALQGAHVAHRASVTDDATGAELRSWMEDPLPVSLADADALAAVAASINAAALATIASLQTDATNAKTVSDAALKAATDAKAVAETARDAALAQVEKLNAQLAALQPVINGVPQFVKKWQLLAGLRIDGIYAPVMAFINALPPAALDLWNGSAGVERDSPFLVPFKSQFGKTDADLDAMFTRYATITQADVLALA